MKLIILLCLFLIGLVYADNQQFLTEVQTVMKQGKYNTNIRELNIGNDSTGIIQDITNILPLYLETADAFAVDNEYNIFNYSKPKYPAMSIYRFTKLLERYMIYLDNTHHKKQKLIILDKILDDTLKLMSQTKSLMNYYISVGIYKNILDLLDCSDKDTLDILQNYPPLEANYFFEIVELDMDNTFNAIKESFLNDNSKIKEETLKKAEELYQILKSKKLKALKADDDVETQKYESYIEKLRDEHKKLSNLVFLTYDERIKIASFPLVNLTAAPFMDLKPYHAHLKLIDDYTILTSDCP